jgi:hypothetical protein
MRWIANQSIYLLFKINVLLKFNDYYYDFDYDEIISVPTDTE